MRYYHLDEKTALRLYHEYLRGIAYVRGRPFKLPKSLDSLGKNNPGEKKLLFGLVKRLKQSQITQQRTFEKFITVCKRMYSDDQFHLRTFLDDFDKIMVKFKNFDKMFNEEGRMIDNSFSEIEEYCVMYKITEEQKLRVGNPPPLVKLWKQKKIDDYSFAFIFDVGTIRKQRWAKIYLGSYTVVKQTNLKKFISDNTYLSTVMQNNIAKFQRLFKGVKEYGKEE